MVGVYSITNLQNGKLYVGSSSNISERWTEHKRLLNKGMHHSLHLQASWTKYGSESFLWEVLEHTSNFTLITREQYWIDAFDSADKKYGYNMSPAAGSTLGIKLNLSPDELKRRREAITGDKNPNKNSKKGKDHWKYGYRKPVCKNGHKRSQENLNTQGACRICFNEKSKEFQRRKIGYYLRHNIALS